MKYLTPINGNEILEVVYSYSHKHGHGISNNSLDEAALPCRYGIKSLIKKTCYQVIKEEHNL
jgi:hypothetical protein